MAKRIIKKKKYKFNLYALGFLVLSFCFYVGTSIFVRANNVNITKQIHDNETSIASYRHQNEALTVEIQNLSAYDRVMAIASGDQMSLLQDNIITISKGE